MIPEQWPERVAFCEEASCDTDIQSPTRKEFHQKVQGLVVAICSHGWKTFHRQSGSRFTSTTLASGHKSISLGNKLEWGTSLKQDFVGFCV